MATKNQKTRSGNRVMAKFDGKVIGLIQSARFSDDYAPEPASGIGSIDPVEHVPTQAKHVVTVESMVLDVGSMREAGIASVDSDQVMQGLVFDIVVQSVETNEVLRQAIGCSYASGEVNIQKHAIVTASATFNALKVSGNKL